MKRLMLIGGIISMILPAMADKDLSEYHLLNDETENTCAGPDGYTGFESGDVTMAPVFIRNCTNGQYYNATASTAVSNHPVWNSEENKCTNPVTDEVIASIDSEEACNNSVLDYYAINACENVESGQYEPAAVPTVELTENGFVLKSTTPENCPEGYQDGSDGDRATEQDCYKYCGTGAEHTTVSADDLAKLHATNATHLRPILHKEDGACVMSIVSGDCAAGYEFVDLSSDDSYTMEACELGHTDNEGKCPSTIAAGGALAAGTWFAKSDTYHLEASGTISYNSETQECSATVTSVKFHGAEIGDTFVIPLGKTSQEQSCLRTPSMGNAFAEGFLTHYTDGLYTSGQMCLPKTVNITWKDQNLSADNPANTCTYGGGLTLPESPSKDGYEFVGWTVGKVTAPSTGD